MALRQYSCGCGHVWDELIDGDYPEYMECPHCSQPAQYVWAVTTIVAPSRNHRVDFRPGYDLAAGKYFDTKRDRDNWLAENNLKMDKSASGSIVYDNEKFIKRNFTPRGHQYVPRKAGQ